MNERLDETLASAITEASGLRDGLTIDLTVQDAQHLLGSLQEFRQALDRVEYILRKVAQLRARAQETSEAAKAILSSEWDRLVTEPRRADVSTLAPRERYAHTNVRLLKEQRNVRSTEQDLRLCEGALEVLRIMHRGMDGTRQDIHAALRGLAWERTLER